jgi:hypothetical protein
MLAAIDLPIGFSSLDSFSYSRYDNKPIVDSFLKNQAYVSFKYNNYSLSSF